MPRVTQFCVSVDNKPGALARLCEVLRNVRVNIRSIFVSNDADGSWVNIVADPADRAERALVDREYKLFSEEVLMLQLENQPGELEHIAIRMAHAGMNINYVYGSTGGEPTFTLLLNCDDIELAEKQLDEWCASVTS